MHKEKDRADAVLTLVVLSMPLLILVFAFAVNLNASVTIKGEYANISQASAQNSVREIMANGSLGTQTVKTYLHGVFSEIKQKQENGVLPTSSICSTVKVNGVIHKSPYVVVRLSETRKQGHGQVVWSGSFDVETAKNFIDNSINILPKSKAHVIDAELYVASPSTVTFGGLHPCSYYHSNTSAIAFGTNKDLQ